MTYRDGICDLSERRSIPLFLYTSSKTAKKFSWGLQAKRRSSFSSTGGVASAETPSVDLCLAHPTYNSFGGDYSLLRSFYSQRHSDFMLNSSELSLCLNFEFPYKQNIHSEFFCLFSAFMCPVRTLDLTVTPIC